jgi:hypothetical protein
MNREMRDDFKTQGKMPLGRPRSRWEDNIKINLR